MQAEWSGDATPVQGDFPPWRAMTGQSLVKAKVNSPKKGIVNPYKKNQALDTFRTVTADLSGGYYEDGVVGPVKLTKSIAMTTTFAAWALLDAPDAFNEVAFVRARPFSSSLPLLDCSACLAHALRTRRMRCMQRLRCLWSMHGLFVWLCTGGHMLSVYMRACGVSRMLMLTPVQGNLLAHVRHGFEYVMNCYIEDPSNSKKRTGDVYVYSVGDALIESQLWRTAEDVEVRPALCSMVACICCNLCWR